MPTLFEIEEELLQIDELLDELNGDISDPAIEKFVMEWLAKVKGQEAAKLDGYVNLIRKWEMLEAAAKEEAERYTKLAKSYESRVDAFKDRMKRHFELTKVNRIITASGRTLAIQNNGGKVPVELQVVDPAALEKRFQRVQVTVNAEAVRAALEAGEQLGFAKLGERGTHLRIRP
jgi:hypothetical protein